MGQDRIDCRVATKPVIVVVVVLVVVVSSNKLPAMRTAYILSLMMSPLLIISSPNAIREGGIRITGRTPPPKSTGRSYSGVQLGSGRISNVTRQRSFPTTTTTTIAPPAQGLPSKSSVTKNQSFVTNLKVKLFLNKRKPIRLDCWGINY